MNVENSNPNVANPTELPPPPYKDDKHSSQLASIQVALILAQCFDVKQIGWLEKKFAPTETLTKTQAKVISQAAVLLEKLKTFSQPAESDEQAAEINYLRKKIDKCIIEEMLADWLSDETVGGYKEGAARCITLAYVHKKDRLELEKYKLTSLPAAIGSLQHLESIYLADNALTELTPEIGKLKNLKSIDLVRNKLTRLPQEVCDCESLTELHLNENELVALPSKMNKLTNLRNLHVQKNNLESLPPEIGELKYLYKIWLDYNPNLSEIPDSFENIPCLTVLTCSGTDIIETRAEEILDACKNKKIELEKKVGQYLKDNVSIFL